MYDPEKNHSHSKWIYCAVIIIKACIKVSTEIWKTEILLEKNKVGAFETMPMLEILYICMKMVVLSPGLRDTQTCALAFHLILLKKKIGSSENKIPLF